jgi:hypothetical protein
MANEFVKPRALMPESLTRLFGLVLLALLGASVGAAEPYRWRNVVVGGGGFAPNILFSPAEKGLAYLRTDMGGAYRWDSKRRRWIPLQDWNAVSSYMGIESIAPDPKDPKVVYLAAGMGHWGEAAIWRSADRGKTWRVTPVPFKMGGNEDGRGLGERLAVNPNRTSTLFFGSRHDGLQHSDDSGATWRKVESFPHAGRGVPQSRRATHAGIAFVVFDPASGTRERGSSLLFAGVADPGANGVYASRDGGRSWARVPGGPALLPVKAALAGRRLVVAFSTGIGPNGIASGAVWSLDTGSFRWTDITPEASPEGGYMGVALDPGRPGRIAVSTVNRWQRGDTVWLSGDGGRSWESLRDRSRRDTRRTPFLNWGGEEAEFGHWTSGLAIDPFDPGTIAYTTGATVYRTRDGRKRKGTMLWRPWVRGIEQTAVITLISPTGGASLISGFGDIAGFVHERLDRSPARMHLNPRLSNTNNLDYAGRAPQVVVRSGTLHAEQQGDGASLGWSDDGGRSWQPLRVPPLKVGAKPPQRYDLRGEAAIHVSADGSTFVVATPVPMATRDRGASWFAPRGLPEATRPIADKLDPALFYALDFEGGRLLVSRDGARSFAPAAATGLPTDLTPARTRHREEQWPLQAAPGRRGELWLLVSGRLWTSRDAGESFEAASPASVAIEKFGLGKEAPGSAHPALYAIATAGGVRGVYRSLDGGASWTRINDDAHQWGLRFRAISGDPRRFGRVYIATDGRGIFYGDPAPR